MYRDDLRNIAIIAHVDHGKTTLVDALFQQGGIFRENQDVVERVMDSNDQERERGITILAKTTSVRFGSVTLQIVDTPGHADFGGEVERTLRMVDGVLLLVDAAEGPLPQTRFVLRKSLALQLPVVVAINKIDRSDARPLEVLDEIYDLFIELGADEKQIDFPVLYTVSRDGTATFDLENTGEDLRPLIQALLDNIPAPRDDSDSPFYMQVNQIGYDEYVGRLAIGRVLAGKIQANTMVHIHGVDKRYANKVTAVYHFSGVKREIVKHARSGDIVALSGLNEVGIGDTLCARDTMKALPRIKIDEPTVSMIFQINDGPFAGKNGGQFLTSRQLRERLEREAYSNVSIKIEAGDTTEQFRVLGRGELQLAVLIEGLRREKYELCVRNPQVVTKQGPHGKQEPTERLHVDSPVQYLGVISDVLGRRKASLTNQIQEGERVRLEFIIPTRGLFGLRGHLLTVTRGTIVMHSVFEGWIDWSGPIQQRINGAMVADRIGNTTPYALFHLQPRGSLFVAPGTEVYEGMIIGEHNRTNDLNVNAVRPKKLTNIRAAGKDENTAVSPPRKMILESCLEWIRDDEMVEVTPEIIRLRKRILAANRRSVIHPDAANQ